LTPPLRDFALLLAAHGERRDGAGNDGVAQLALDLSRRNVAGEIGVGFIKGVPAIDETMRAFASPAVLVYPLFLSDGYFNRVRLPQLLAKARASRMVRVLDPLGLDPLLVDIVVERARAAARDAAFAAEDAMIVLLAHGSSSDPASRQSTERMARRIGEPARFVAVRAAFLEEPPSLAEAVGSFAGPVVVVGLFAGEGRHGAADVPQLVRELGRDRVVFAGNIGVFSGLADLVAAAVVRATTGHAGA
jgi:sirohydrochlorin cobaltochelatase